jgi:hypothetical protein
VVPGLKLCPGEKFDVSVTQLATVGGVHVTTFEHSAAVSETLTFDGQFVMTGAVLSVTVTSKLHVDILFAASFAVYVTFVVPGKNDAPELKSPVNVTQLATVGGVHVIAFEHSEALSDTVMFDGQFAMTGAELSVTVILKLHVEILFAASFAVYVTFVVPGENDAPGLKSLVRVTQLPTVGAVQITTFEHSEAGNDTLISEGQFEMTGAVLSVTITLNVHVDLFPAASVAV